MARTRSARRRPPAPPPAVPPPAHRRPKTVFFLVAGAAVVALGVWWWLRTPAFTLDVNPNRNVLLVTIDTWRADALGASGGRASTPNLDKLAARGARFDFAHSHAVVTLVSHASIFSGLYPYEHGVRDNTGYRFPATRPTAATLLKAQGFATAAFIGGSPLDHRFGLGVGFDLYDDRLNPAEPPSGDRERRADAVVASALDWIGKQSGRWFAFVHVYDPHAPYQPPQDWTARFPSNPYLGEVAWTDAALGPLFDRLTAQPRPTLVIVTGDHGESLGEHGELNHSLFAYESTLHVPLIVSEVGAGMARASLQMKGVAIDTPVRHVDILPTILDAEGVAQPGANAPGVSLRPVIASGGGSDRPSYFEAMTANVTRGWAPLRGVLVGREKYIDLPITELYELDRDPDETTNLATVRTDQTEVLVNILKGFDMTPPGRPRDETPETLERLRSLGYIGGGAVTARGRYTDEDDPKRLVELEQTMHRASEAYQQGRSGDAIALYKNVIAKRNDTEDAYRELALVYWREGRPDAAIGTLESALKNGVTKSEVRIMLGQYLAESGQLEKAIALLESTSGDDPDAFLALGDAYAMAGRPADATRTFKRLTEVDPQNGLAYQKLGVVQLQMGDDATAEVTLRRAIQVDPGLGHAYVALGVLLVTTGRNAEGIDVLKRAVELDATNFDALFNLTKTLFDVGRYDEAHTYGDQFLATAPPARQDDIATIKKLLGKAAGSHV